MINHLSGVLLSHPKGALQKYLQGGSEFPASDLPATQLRSKALFPSIPAFSAISATPLVPRQG